MSFKTDNWLIGADRRLLVTIALTDPESKRETNYPSNPTLAFCDIPDPSTGAFTYGGTVYQPTVQSFKGNAASIDFRGGASDADATLVLANIRYPFQFKHAVGAAESNQYNVKLSQLFADYLWSGATFTAYCYCKVGATETNQVVFSGIVYDVSATVDSVSVRVIQDKKATMPKPDVEGPGSSTYPSVVQRINYASAPDTSIGQTLPIIYSGASFSPSFEDASGLCVNPRNVLNLFTPVPIEARYDGTYISKYALSSYPTQTAPATTLLYSYVYYGNGDRIGVAKDTDVVITSNVQELLLNIKTQSQFKMYINPTDFVAKAGTVTNEGRAFDGIGTTYAEVAYSAGNGQIDLRIPNGSTYGRVRGASVFALLAAGGTTIGGDPDGTVCGKFGLWDVGAGAYQEGSTNLTKANLRDGGFFTYDLTTTTYNLDTWQNWQWQNKSGSSVTDQYFRIESTKNLTSARLIACGLRIAFEPLIAVSNGTNWYDTTNQPGTRTLKEKN